MPDWKQPKPAAPAKPAPGPAGPPPAAKAAPGAPGPADAGAAAKAAQGAPGPAAAAGAKKPKWVDRILGKAGTKQERGPGRTPKEDEKKKEPKKEPLTPEEIERGGKIISRIQIALFGTVLGKTWLSGHYGKDDEKVLLPGHMAWVERFQIRITWFWTLLQSQTEYSEPRVRDEKNREAFKAFFGLKKKVKEIEVKVADARGEVERGTANK